MTNEHLLGMRVMLDYIFSWDMMVDLATVDWPHERDHTIAKWRGLREDYENPTSAVLHFVKVLDQANFEHLCGVIFEKWQETWGKYTIGMYC